VIEHELPGFESVLVGFTRRHVGTRALGGILLAATLYCACGRFGCSAIRGLTVGRCPSSCCVALPPSSWGYPGSPALLLRRSGALDASGMAERHPLGPRGTVT
jgi:hypothetical protein